MKQSKHIGFVGKQTLANQSTKKGGFLTRLGNALGKRTAVILLGTALTGGGIVGVKALAERNYARGLVPIEKERAAITQIYKLNDKSLVDQRVLNFVDQMAKKHHISRRRVLVTLEKNRSIDALAIRVKAEKNPAVRQRLNNALDILTKASEENEFVRNRLDNMVKQKGTLDKVTKTLRE